MNTLCFSAFHTFWNERPQRLVIELGQKWSERRLQTREQEFTSKTNARGHYRGYIEFEIKMDIVSKQPNPPGLVFPQNTKVVCHYSDVCLISFLIKNQSQV